MSNQLSQYAISLSIRGIQPYLDVNAVEMINNEIAMRPHLQNIEIIQKAKERPDELIGKLVFWGFNGESAGKQVSEELFEIICAVLNHVEGISVHVNGINEYKTK